MASVTKLAVAHFIMLAWIWGAHLDRHSQIYKRMRMLITVGKRKQQSCELVKYVKDEDVCHINYEYIEQCCDLVNWGRSNIGIFLEEACQLGQG